MCGDLILLGIRAVREKRNIEVIVHMLCHAAMVKIRGHEKKSRKKRKESVHCMRLASRQALVQRPSQDAARGHFCVSCLEAEARKESCRRRKIAASA